jgi:DNA-binding CsgD family transcriptional regulator
VIVRPVLCKPFVGRLQELAYLRERRLEAASSHGGLVVVAGEAGVGKSRLISEFCSSLAYSRWKIGYGACLEFGSRPYGPILEVFARIDASPFELGAASTKQEQVDAIVDRLATIAAKTALVVVIEDLHWADAATLDLLAYLGTRLQHLRVLAIASIRADELHPEHPATAAMARIVRNARPGRIDLAPLRGVELQTFIDEALAGFALPEETRRAIMLAADGNPFFTEELLKSAVERRTAQMTSGAHDELPQTVRAALLERLRPFDEAERRVVTQAALIGRTFHLDLLAATLETQPAELLPALRRARDFQLVEELSPAVFRFRHGLTRDAIYHEFLGAELQPRHRTIALALEHAPADERTLEALAYHWWAAGVPQQAAHYNERAGDAAARIHAHEDAIAFYARALEAGVDGVARGSVVEKIADRRLALAWTNEARATYTAAADQFQAAGAHEREARCRVAAAITAYGTGMADPIGRLEAMLTHLDDAEYLARTRVHLGLAWLAATYGYPTRATRHLEQVDPRALADSTDIALRCHNVAAWVAMTLGNLETFQREHAAWVAAARAGGSLQQLAVAYANGAMCSAFFGLHEEAQEHLERGFRAAGEARSRHIEETLHAFAATCYLLCGELHRARIELAHVSPSSENHVNATFGRAWGTVVGAALDDQELIERWFDAFEPTIEAKPEVEVGGAYAGMMARRGRTRDAASLLHRTLPECEVLRGNVITLLAVGRYGAHADRERARTYLERAAAAPAEMPERPALALFDAIACERDGRRNEAAALAHDAADGFRRLGYQLLEAQALELAGDVDAALAVFRRCGAAYDVCRLELARRSEPDGGGAAAGMLSDRELEIARLAARGRSNIEIARALHITHKTVEKHLGSVYRKLDISSRTQLGALVVHE